MVDYARGQPLPSQSGGKIQPGCISLSRARQASDRPERGQNPLAGREDCLRFERAVDFDRKGEEVGAGLQVEIALR